MCFTRINIFFIYIKFKCIYLLLLLSFEDSGTEETEEEAVGDPASKLMSGGVARALEKFSKVRNNSIHQGQGQLLSPRSEIILYSKVGINSILQNQRAIFTPRSEIILYAEVKK